MFQYYILQTLLYIYVDTNETYITVVYCVSAGPWKILFQNKQELIVCKPAWSQYIVSSRSTFFIYNFGMFFREVGS
jgi:hypothetical protein